MNDKPTPYVLRVHGPLAPHAAARFAGLSVAHDLDGTTTLSGLVAGQAGLHSVLRSIRELNLTLISIERRSLADPELARLKRLGPLSPVKT